MGRSSGTAIAPGDVLTDAQRFVTIGPAALRAAEISHPDRHRRWPRPAIRAATSWTDLHTRLAALGLRYQRKGSGAVLWVGDTAVKASQAGRDCSLLAVERRLGAYQPAPEGLRVAARPEPGGPELHALGGIPRVREVHQRHKRAATQARRDAQAAEREALRAAHRSQRMPLWRSVPPGGWRGRGAELNRQRSLLAARQAAERRRFWNASGGREYTPSAMGPFPRTDEDWLAAQTTGPPAAGQRLIALLPLSSTPAISVVSSPSSTADGWIIAGRTRPTVRPASWIGVGRSLSGRTRRNRRAGGAATGHP